MKKVIAYILLGFVLVGSGCIGTISEHMTPGKTDKKVVAYVEKSGVGSAEDYKGILFPSLAELRKLQNDFEAAVALTNQELRHLAEQKKLEEDILRGVLSNDVNIAEAREEFLFDPTTGALAVGLSLLGVSAGGYLGLMRKRPQDITSEDHEKALSEVKGEVTDRDRKIIQLVSSVQKVIDAQPKPQADAMKKLLKDNQLPEVRQAVKEAKAKL